MEDTLLARLKLSQLNTQKQMQTMELKQTNDLRNSITQIDTPIPITPDFFITPIETKPIIPIVKEILPIQPVVTPVIDEILSNPSTVSIKETAEVSDKF